MIGWLIVACEIGFWIFVVAGLASRYIFKKRKLGIILLLCTPIVDFILLAATVIDLKNGAIATAAHGIAAIYIGVSIAFGHSMINWADEQFAHRFAGGKKPSVKSKAGREHARREREGWFRHFIAWLIGSCILFAMIYYIDHPSHTEALLRTFQLWSLILGIDFLISFSYTVFPRKIKN